MARQLIIELVGEASKFTKSLDEAGKGAESWGDKISSAGKKMTAFATVPIVGFLGAATKAAAEDAAAQDNLAKSLINSVGANDKVIKSTEDYIARMMKVTTFSDDELRPAFADLARTTGDVSKAQDLMAIAMDVATGKGIDLETATKAVAKASEGNFAAVNKLIPGLLDLSDKTLTAEDATNALAALFSGQAAASAETAAGKAKMMTRDLGEMTEQIGGALLPILSTLLGVIQPVIDKFLSMDAGTQKIIVIVALAVAAIGPLIGVIGALGTALAFVAANPIVLIIAGIAALAAGLFIAYKKSETFRDIVDTAFTGVRASVETMWRIIEPIFNAFKQTLDALTGPLGAVMGAAGKAGSLIGGIAGKLNPFAMGGTVPGPPGMPVPILAHGGERVVPINRVGDGGGGMTVVVNVGGSVITDRDLGRMVADAVRNNNLIGVT